MGFAGRPALLVLDNCEHVLDGVALFVSRLLSGADPFRVVATSREPLGLDGERLLVLGGLGLPSGDVDVQLAPAVQLFLRAGRGGRRARGPRPNPRCPRSASCAAASTGYRSPSSWRRLVPGALTGRLPDHTEHRLDLLQAPARRWARHSSIRAAIDVSVQLLDDDERSAFRRWRLPGALRRRAGPRRGVADGADRLRRSTCSPGSSNARSCRRCRSPSRPATGSSSCSASTASRRSCAAASGTRSPSPSSTPSRPERITSSPKACSAGRRAAGRRGQRLPEPGHRTELCIDRDEAPDRAFRLLLPMFGAVHQSRGARCSPSDAGCSPAGPRARAVAGRGAGRARHRGRGRWRRHGGHRARHGQPGRPRRHRDRRGGGRAALGFAAGPLATSPVQPGTSRTPGPLPPPSARRRSSGSSPGSRPRCSTSG